MHTSFLILFHTTGYIYYAASSFAAQLDLFWTPKLNVKVLLEGGF